MARHAQKGVLNGKAAQPSQIETLIDEVRSLLLLELDCLDIGRNPNSTTSSLSKADLLFVEEWARDRRHAIELYISTLEPTTVVEVLFFAVLLRDHWEAWQPGHSDDDRNDKKDRATFMRLIGAVIRGLEQLAGTHSGRMLGFSSFVSEQDLVPFTEQADKARRIIAEARESACAPSKAG